MRDDVEAIPDLPARAARGAIVASAMGVFDRLGFAATRVEDLLTAAGIARRTFYKHFASKEDVLASIYELTTHEILRAIDPGSDAGADPLAFVRRAMDGYLDFHAQNGTLLRILVEQAIRSDSALAPLRKRFRTRLVEVLSRAATARGRRSFDPLLGVALISALEGVSLEILEKGATPADVARAKRTMHGLLAHVFG
jgi:AcrR family transcriptional regulator